MLVDQKGDLWDVWEFETERELEEIVLANYHLLYGDQALLFGKAQIKTDDGKGTVPDAYVVDLDSKCWYVVEVEMLHHGVYDHIVRQLTKQINAAASHQAKTILRQRFVAEIEKNKDYRKLFKDAEIPEIKIAEVIEEILREPPRISISIDATSADLESWAASLKYRVLIQQIVRYRNRSNGDSMVQFPDLELAPGIELGGDNGETSVDAGKGRDLLLRLIDAKLLRVGQRLTTSHKKQVFEAIVTASGHLQLPDGGKYSASLAGIKCIQTIAPTRTTVNGLIAWSTEAGETLRDLRDRLASVKDGAAA
jgi:hypothetical protein